jgi:energy-converting hydrogenase Eha subunit C
MTCAPLTNLLPVTVNVYAPAAKLVGLTLLTTGVAFHSVTSLDAVALASATETASTVIVFGLGTVAGAV